MKNNITASKLFSSRVKPGLLKMVKRILLGSVICAAKEQRLDNLKMILEKIVPDITEQYSTVRLDGLFAESKMRCHHAFQISLVAEVIGEFENPTIVDIGDSSGTHLQYIKGMYSDKRHVQCLSVNLDEKAVEKIKRKGMEVLLSRAEDLHQHNIDADIFLCFQMLEHLMDPCRFLYQLSSRTNAKYLIVTVPYLRHSRVGLHNIRMTREESVSAETTHIFELDPEDWKLIIKHSGWDIAYEKIYLQYPRKGILRITRPLWQHFDLEGFYGLILRRNDTWSSRYKDWQ